MALETLKDMDKIGGFKVLTLEGVDEPTGDARINRGDGIEIVTWDYYDEIREDFPVCIDKKNNSISHKIQNGPIRENGVNGCQVDTLIKTARIIVQGLHEKFPCEENERCLTHLDNAISALDDRTNRRTRMGIEGTNQEHRADTDGHE